MKKFNVTLLSLLAVAFVGTSILPAVAGEGCCSKKQKAEATEDCCKDKAKAEAKGDAKANEAAKTADASKPAEAEKTSK
ncbi:MAG: hypothetical protein K2Y39_18220 [Candidatus Obscuribacterales bacterium]|nr:hypothetical protein [Candidatus Obscuribacterales bacterium]